MMKSIKETSIRYSIDLGNSLKIWENRNPRNLDSTPTPTKETSNKPIVQVLIPLLCFVTGMVWGYLLLGAIHGKIGKLYKYRAGIVVKLRSDDPYMESHTLNCVSKKLCSEDSYAVFDGESVKLICDETTNIVTLEDMEGCIHEEDDGHEDEDASSTSTIQSENDKGETSMLRKKKNNDVHKNELTKDKNSNEKPTPVTVAAVRGGKKDRDIKYNNLRCLVDSGSSDSLILKEFANTLRKKNSVFDTGNGTMSTSHETKISFTLPEFSDKKIITWDKFNVGEKKNLGGYDMIIGRDICDAIGMDVRFSKSILEWEGIQIPMRDFNRLRQYNFSRKEFRMMIKEVKEPIVTEEATKRMIKILDSNYKKANLRDVVKLAVHLKEKEREQLYKLLVKYQEIFDGTLGEWETDPVYFELEEGA